MPIAVSHMWLTMPEDNSIVKAKRLAQLMALIGPPGPVGGPSDGGAQRGQCAWLHCSTRLSHVLGVIRPGGHPSRLVGLRPDLEQQRWRVVERPMGYSQDTCKNRT